MRIKFLESIGGTNYSHKCGDEVEWPDDAEAQRFVAAGIARLIESDRTADGARGAERAVAGPGNGGKNGSRHGPRANGQGDGKGQNGAGGDGKGAVAGPGNGGKNSTGQ